MPIQVLERLDSPKVTLNATSASAERSYDVFPTPSEEEALAAANAQIPLTYGAGLLVRLELSIDPTESPIAWVVRASFGLLSRDEDEDDPALTFDISTETVNRKASFATISSYAPAGSGPIPDFKNLIGYANGDIQGVDVVVPKMEFQQQQFVPIPLVTNAWLAFRAGLVGCWNVAPFRGFPPGEVLYLGCSGSRRGKKDFDVNHRFAHSANATGLTIGSITGINKMGWDHLWVYYTFAISNNCQVQLPRSVYIERVYPPADLNLLGV